MSQVLKGKGLDQRGLGNRAAGWGRHKQRHRGIDSVGLRDWEELGEARELAVSESSGQVATSVRGKRHKGDEVTKVPPRGCRRPHLGTSRCALTDNDRTSSLFVPASFSQRTRSCRPNSLNLLGPRVLCPGIPVASVGPEFGSCFVLECGLSVHLPPFRTGSSGAVLPGHT